jgi:hypothetical protein
MRQLPKPSRQEPIERKSFPSSLAENSGPRCYTFPETSLMKLSPRD